jgi:penicillin amidase
LYLEALDPDDPGRYRTPSGTAAFDTREEIIQVKGAPAVHLTVRATRHGPVLSDAATWTDLEPSLTASRHVIALRWTALEPDTDMVAAGLALARAQTTEQFIRASRLWLAPMQNMVVADRRGTIAMVAAGRVPVRRSDNDLWGMAPAPGWESRYDWVGWIPYDETPRLLDPPIGFIATANQRIHEPGYPHFLGTDWALPYRQQRIEQLLDLKVRHNLDDLRAIQQDEVSLAARALIPWFRRARSNHPLAELVRTAQEQFDGQMRAEDAAPLIFWAWHRALSQRLLSQRIGMSLYERLIQQRSFQDLLESVLASNDPFWCDDRNTQVLDSCQHQADAALGDALSELSDRFGRSPDQWRWSAAHQAVGEHRPMSRVALLRDHFETRTGVGGDTFTVNATRVGLGPTPPGRYSASHGPSLKALYDVKAPENSRIVHSTGQSGLPWNAHYRDLLPRWKSGDGIPLWRPADQEPVAVLRLVP